MKNKAYIQPIVDVEQIESEQFIAVSLTDTSLDDLGINNIPTDAEGHIRALTLDDFKVFE